RLWTEGSQGCSVGGREGRSLTIDFVDDVEVDLLDGASRGRLGCHIERRQDASFALLSLALSLLDGILHQVDLGPDRGGQVGGRAGHPAARLAAGGCCSTIRDHGHEGSSKI